MVDGGGRFRISPIDVGERTQEALVGGVTGYLAFISSNRPPPVFFQASFRGLTGKAESRTYCLPLGQLTAEYSSSSDAHGTSEPWGN